MRVFLTGASSGIGEALAVEYARRHGQRLQIGLLARRAAELERVAARLAPATVSCYQVDITDRRALFDAAGAFCAGGVPDVVIANAGISVGTSGARADDADAIARVIDTNLIALANTFLPFVAPMRGRGSGRLVGMASIAGIRGLPGAGPYSASKAAAINYCESLRVELAGSGIKVVTIAPGYIATPMTDGNAYPMPFLMPAERFARRSVDAIERGARYAVFPWQMAIVARLLAIMPRAIYDRLAARAPRKAQQHRPAHQATSPDPARKPELTDTSLPAGSAGPR